MSDEFDDLVEPSALLRRKVSRHRAGDRRRPRVPRLVSRLYASASGPLRAALMDCLLRPLGTLGLAGIAAGAFAGFLQRGGTGGGRVVVDDLGRYSNDQIFELARFVEQVSPDALQQFAGLIADNPLGMATFSASAAVLLLRALRPAVSQPQAFRQEGRRTNHPAHAEGDGRT